MATGAPDYTTSIVDFSNLSKNLAVTSSDINHEQIGSLIDMLNDDSLSELIFQDQTDPEIISTFTLELKEVLLIHNLIFHFNLFTGGLNMSTALRLEHSKDNSSFTTIIDQQDSGVSLDNDYDATLKDTALRFLRFTITTSSNTNFKGAKLRSLVLIA